MSSGKALHSLIPCTGRAGGPAGLSYSSQYRVATGDGLGCLLSLQPVLQTGTGVS